jgi:hypothetical protein
MSEERAHRMNEWIDYLPSKRDKVMIYKECGLSQYAVVGSTRQLKVAIGSTRQP